MAPTKNLYIRDDDGPIWDQADVLAKLSKQSLSQIVTTALRHFMAGPPDIYVHLVDPDRASAATFADSGGRPILSYPALIQGVTGWRIWTVEGDEYFIPGDPLSPPIKAAREWLENLESRRRMEEALDAAGKELTEIEVDVADTDGNRWTESFVGRWLVSPDDYQDGDACYGLALTKKGKIAVYRSHINNVWAPTLDVFDSMADIDVKLSDEALAIAAVQLGQKRVVRRDI